MPQPPYPERPNWRKVHIIGAAGSGKTTLARRMSAELGAPAYDLDFIAYTRGAGPKISEAERRAAVRRILAEPCWVTEGVYLWWAEELFSAADVILWLDVPWRVAAWRIVRRHIAASLAGTNRQPGLRRLIRFLVATRVYYQRPDRAAPVDVCDDAATSRAATVSTLAGYQDKVIHRLR